MTTTPNIYKFRTRSVVALSVASLISAAGFLWPFFIGTKSSNPHQYNQWFFWIAVPLALTVLVVEISNERLDAKSVALLGILAALTAALRPIGTGVAGIEPMWFILILSARIFGPAFGFILGILALFVSAFLTGGFGPWLAYQMFASFSTAYLRPCSLEHSWICNFGRGPWERILNFPMLPVGVLAQTSTVLCSSI
jgi:energy-coupling factor transport system substrate-specific component